MISIVKYEYYFLPCMQSITGLQAKQSCQPVKTNSSCKLFREFPEDKGSGGKRRNETTRYEYADKVIHCINLSDKDTFFIYNLFIDSFTIYSFTIYSFTIYYLREREEMTGRF